MKKKKLAWEIYPSFLIVILFSLVTVSLYTARTVRHDYYKRVERELHSAAAIVAEDLSSYLSSMDPSKIGERCKTLGAASIYRITVMHPSGEVVGDSEKEPDEMDNHGEREEIKAAIADGDGQARRYSQTLKIWMMYVARLVSVDGKEAAVVRVSLPLSDIDNSLSTVRNRIMLAGLLIAGLAALMSVLVARQISHPLERLRLRAEMLTSGSPLEHIPSSKIEEIDSLAQTINQMVDRLHNLELMRQDFVANVSHELKTPITSIKGFTETLLDGAMTDADDLERFLKIIDKQSNRLQSIVEDLLVLSSIEHHTDNNEIEFQESDVGGIIENAVQTCRAKSAKKNIELNANVGGKLSAGVNIQLLEQALTNLIDNAIKYSEQGTEVTVTGLSDGNEIVMSVSDQGPGIAKKHLARLFERFYRVDKSRSRNLGGTGLGLAIVKRIALAHGGRVEVESEIDQGSTFSIIIPSSI